MDLKKIYSTERWHWEIIKHEVRQFVRNQNEIKRNHVKLITIVKLWSLRKGFKITMKSQKKSTVFHFRNFTFSRFGCYRNNSCLSLQGFTARGWCTLSLIHHLNFPILLRCWKFFWKRYVTNNVTNFGSFCTKIHITHKNFLDGWTNSSQFFFKNVFLKT